MTDDQNSAEDERDEDITPFDEILSVVFELEAPRTAGEIASPIDVSEDVVREHLDRLETVDVVAANTEATPTTYYPEPGYLWYQQVRGIAQSRDRDELEMLVTTFSGSIEQYQDLSGFETLEGLRESLQADDVSDEERIKRKHIAADWESDEHRLALIEAALEWYELFTTDPGSAEHRPDL